MSITTSQTPVVLEPASQEFVEATAKPPFLWEAGPHTAPRLRPPRRRGAVGAPDVDFDARPEQTGGIMLSSRQSPQAKTEMTRPTPPTDPLVEALASRLHRVDLVGWQRIAAWAEKLELSFEDLRLLLALKLEDGPTGVSELADLGGLSLDAAYPAIHSLRGRGYLREERRQYSLSEQGQELVATLDAAHREGIQAYVDHLDPHERRRLDEAFGIAR